jgi:hypothetical protein
MRVRVAISNRINESHDSQIDNQDSKSEDECKGALKALTEIKVAKTVRTVIDNMKCSSQRKSDQSSETPVAKLFADVFEAIIGAVYLDSYFHHTLASAAVEADEEDGNCPMSKALGNVHLVLSQYGFFQTDADDLWALYQKANSSLH